MAAREAAEYSLRLGLPYDRHYLERAAELWIETARANQAANGPVDLSANAFHAGDRRGDVAGRSGAGGRHLRRAGRAAADRRSGGGATGRWRGATRRSRTGALPAPAFPAVLRRHESYMDIWREDLVEWELDGDPVAVLARLIAETCRSHRSFTRPALRALLLFADPGFSLTNLPARRRAGRGARAACRPTRCCARSSACSSTRRPRCGRRSCGAPAKVLTPRTLRPGAQGAGRPGAGGRRCGAARCCATTDFVGGAAVADADLPRRRATSGCGWRRWRASGSARTRRARRACCWRPPARRRAPIQKGAEAKLERLVKVGGDEVATLLRQARDVEDGDRRETRSTAMLRTVAAPRGAA